MMRRIFGVSIVVGSWAFAAPGSAKSAPASTAPVIAARSEDRTT
jgi:hypothetical protein